MKNKIDVWFAGHKVYETQSLRDTKFTRHKVYNRRNLSLIAGSSNGNTILPRFATITGGFKIKI